VQSVRLSGAAGVKNNRTFFEEIATHLSGARNDRRSKQLDSLSLDSWNIRVNRAQMKTSRRRDSGVSLGRFIIKPASKYLNDVILSDAKNLAFSCCYEILHSVQDNQYNCRVNNFNNPPLPPFSKVGLE
jgi:hypothetical protein